MALSAITASLLTNGRQGPRQFQGVFDVIPFKVSLLDTSLAASLASQVDIAVPGAELGDLVLLACAIDLEAGVLTGAVLSTGNVTITFQNNNDGAANTTLVAARACKGVVLKFKSNVFDNF